MVEFEKKCHFDMRKLLISEQLSYKIHTLFCVQVKVLTELGLFAEAVREIYSRILGEDVPVFHRSYTGAEKAWV